MKYVILYGAAVIITCLGSGMFCLAAQEIKMEIPWKWFWTMAVCNMITAFFLQYVYAAETSSVLKYLLLCIVLWICAWTDYKKYLILNRILAVALIVRIIWLAAEFCIFGIPEMKYIIISALAAAAMLAAASLLCKAAVPGSVGFGDIKLLLVMGLYTGTELAAEIMIYTFLILFLVSVVLLILKKVSRKTVIPFAPFLLAGAVLTPFLTGI